MSLDFDISASKAKQFGLIEKIPEIEDEERVLIEVNSIEEKNGSVLIDSKISVRGKQNSKKVKYSIKNISSAEATFAGWAFILSYTEQGGFFSDEKISEEQKELWKNNAKKFLEIATKESDGNPNADKKSCLPYYLLAKHHLYKDKWSIKLNLYKSLKCSDLFPDVYNTLMEFEDYSLKKMLLAKEGLKKFPTNEILIDKVADYYIKHNEHDKAVDLILNKKKLIPLDEWKNYRRLRLTLIFPLLKLGKFEDARKEASVPVRDEDYQRDSNLFLQGLVEYEAKDYKKATDYFIETIGISKYESSEVRASLYFLIDCYTKTGQISKLEELVKDFKPNRDYFVVEDLGFNYSTYARKILKSALKVDISESIRAKISGLLAYNYYQEIETNNSSSSGRDSWGRNLTKKELEMVKKAIGFLKDAAKYYPRSAFFNSLGCELNISAKQYNEAMKCDLKSFHKNEDDDSDLFSYVELQQCSDDFIENYAHHLKENIGDVDKYIKERLGVDIDTLKEKQKFSVVSEIFDYLKSYKGMDNLTKTEEESSYDFIFNIAYCLKSNNDASNAKILYEKYIEIKGGDSGVLNNLAIIYEGEKNIKKAKILITKAKKLAGEGDEIVNRNYSRIVSNSKKEADAHRSSIRSDAQKNNKLTINFNFDDGKISLGVKECQIPLGSIEYYICKHLFKKPFGERIEEGSILEEWDRMKGKQENSRTVYDAHRRINTRAKNDLGIAKLIEHGSASVWIRKEAVGVN